MKIGDMVILKSGGPLMTVTSISLDNYVDCEWFVGDEVRQGTFPDDAVIKVE